MIHTGSRLWRTYSNINNNDKNNHNPGWVQPSINTLDYLPTYSSIRLDTWCAPYSYHSIGG